MYTIEEIYSMDVIEVYNLIRRGDLLRFPRGYWKRKESLNDAAKCTRYLFEDVLKYNDKMMKKYNSVKLFKQNKLGGMLSHCFNNSPYLAINNAYPNRFKEWEFSQVPKNFWTKEKGIEICKWLIEEKLKISDEELKDQLSHKFFIENNLFNLIQNCFNNSPYNAINSVYPNKFKEWEFRSTPNNFWTKEKGIEAIKWLVEEKLMIPDSEKNIKLTKKIFKENGLSGMLDTCFNNNINKAIKETYPDRF